MRPGRLILQMAPYLGYGVAVFGLCLYVTFPYDLLAQYASRHWVPSRIHVKTDGVESLFSAQAYGFGERRWLLTKRQGSKRSHGLLICGCGPIGWRW